MGGAKGAVGIGKGRVLISVLVVLGVLAALGPFLRQSLVQMRRVAACDSLMIVAHPDDESIWGGAHLREGGWLVVCLTNGDNPVRRAEYSRAISKAGAVGIMFSYPDLTNGQRDDWATAIQGIDRNVRQIITSKRWRRIATHNPDGEYGHIHHQMTSREVAKTSRATGNEDRLLYFGKFYDQGKIPSALPQLSAEDLAFKNGIIRLYASQLFFINLYQGHMLPYENWVQAAAWQQGSTP